MHGVFANWVKRPIPIKRKQNKTKTYKAQQQPERRRPRQQHQQQKQQPRKNNETTLQNGTETDSHPRSGVLNLSCLTMQFFHSDSFTTFLYFHWKLFVTIECVCVFCLLGSDVAVVAILYWLIPVISCTFIPPHTHTHRLEIYWSEKINAMLYCRQTASSTEIMHEKRTMMHSDSFFVSFFIHKRWLILFDV